MSSLSRLPDIRHITLGETLDRPISTVTWPASLQHLTFAGSFNTYISGFASWPASAQEGTFEFLLSTPLQSAVSKRDMATGASYANHLGHGVQRRTTGRHLHAAQFTDRSPLSCERQRARTTHSLAYISEDSHLFSVQQVNRERSMAPKATMPCLWGELQPAHRRRCVAVVVSCAGAGTKTSTNPLRSYPYPRPSGYSSLGAISSNLSRRSCGRLPSGPWSSERKSTSLSNELCGHCRCMFWRSASISANPSRGHVFHGTSRLSIWARLQPTHRRGCVAGFPDVIGIRSKLRQAHGWSCMAVVVEAADVRTALQAANCGHRMAIRPDKPRLSWALRCGQLSSVAKIASGDDV